MASSGINYDVFLPPPVDDPPNIPPAATAAAATSNMENVADSETDEEDGSGSEIDDDEEYTADITAQYNEYGLVRSNINYDDDSAFEDEEPVQDMSYYRAPDGRKGRKLTAGGPMRPDISGMTKERANAVLKLWRKERKKYTDSIAAAEMKRRKSGGDDGIDYTGVATDRLRLMTTVEEAPICVGHNYPTKEILMMRIAEEANLKNCEVAIGRSDARRLHVKGRKGVPFSVKASFGLNSGWKVTVCEIGRTDIDGITPQLPPVRLESNPENRETTAQEENEDDGDKEDLLLGEDSNKEDDDDYVAADDEENDKDEDGVDVLDKGGTGDDEDQVGKKRGVPGRQSRAYGSFPSSEMSSKSDPT